MDHNSHKKGLFTQQKEFVQKACHGSSLDPPEDMPSFSSKNPVPSRHSPPASRPSSHHVNTLEGMGNLNEVFSMAKQWEQFKQYLATFSEGEDSDGQPLTMVRYANFLEMFARLDTEHKMGQGKERIVQMVMEIADSKEQFLGRERCLQCIDSGVRREVLNNIKNVRSGNADAGPNVFILIYPRVVDKLGEMLGNYQNRILEEEAIVQSRSRNDNLL